MNIYLNAFFRSIIESISEFLPISSTGHLFLFSTNFPFTSIENATELDDLFDIFIQSGAILSVLVIYFSFLKNRVLLLQNFILKKTTDREGYDFFKSILLGSLPILVFGFLFKKYLDQIKQSNELLLILGLAWLIGGIIILFIETKVSTNSESKSFISIKNIFWIGLFQCLALIPGVSRSGATIMTSRYLGIKKEIAAEYSFFLAIPVLILASSYKLFKYRALLNSENILILAFGFICSFIFCLIVIRFFLFYIKKNSFSIFGYYRILLGMIVIGFYFNR